MRDDEILLGMRQHTGYADGHWHLPSGHLEAGESLPAGIIREAEEEIGLRLTPEQVRFVQLVHHAGPGEEPRVGVFFEATRWAGEPVNAEPHKCAELRWFPARAIPPETLDYPAEAIARYLRGESFGVHGL
ncbi:hypothetical protein GCM10010124_07550 [Pilimelia terevasa]|uniref:Nudix hydrolase domain-containing protein n=1 Tax=Pilimelia terevasa TaxID=53372 RepID=A0A8J3BF72_9ACTN|nr:hypothetical protein GCM10010124_07550 [Pilimelia terevasa]